MNKLKPCPDCGHQVSPNAAACPNCGATLKATGATTGGSALLVVGSFVLGLILAVVLSALPGEDGPPALRVSLGLLGLIAPPATALTLASRR